MQPQQPEQGINPVEPPGQGINPVPPPGQGINPVPPQQSGSTGETEAPPPPVRTGRSPAMIAAWVGGVLIVIVAIVALISR